MYVDLKLDFLYFSVKQNFSRWLYPYSVDMKMGLEFHATNDKGIEKKGSRGLYLNQ